MMNFNGLKKLSLLGAFAASLAACGEQPTNETYDDVATDMAGMMSEGEASETELLELSARAATGDVPFGLGLDLEGNIRGQRGAVTFAVNVDCEDAEGEAVTCGDDAARAMIELDIEGEVDTARYDAEVDREASFEADASHEAVVRINGDSSWQAKSSFTSMNGDTKRSFDFDYEAKYEDVLVRKSDHTMIAGRIEYDVKAERKTETESSNTKRTHDIYAEATVESENTVKLVLDGVRAYTVNTVSGEVRFAGEL